MRSPRETVLTKQMATMIFQAVSFLCLVAFILSFYGPLSLFSRPVLWCSLAVGVMASLASICCGIVWHQHKATVAVGIGVLLVFILVAGVPIMLLFLVGLPPDD
jgi:hypothetical protein